VRFDQHDLERPARCGPDMRDVLEVECPRLGDLGVSLEVFRVPGDASATE
jgi:hypothetical protein